MDNCKKCNSDDILTRFVEADELIDHSSHFKINDEFVSSSEYDFYFQLKAKKEHLNKHCRNCQYAWREDTADNRLDKAILK